jgi:hypothetical protein
MTPSEELEHLKSLISQLNEKIRALEQMTKKAATPKTPAQQLRTILIGPPGAGQYCIFLFATEMLKNSVKVRVHKLHESATSIAYAT